MIVLIVLAVCVALANLRAVGFTLAAMKVDPASATWIRFVVAAPAMGLILCGWGVWSTLRRRWLPAILSIAIALGAMLTAYAILYSFAFRD